MIKFLTRWAFRALLLALVLVIGLLLAKDVLIKSLAESRLQTATGLETRIGRFEVGLLTPTITIENMVIYNPAAFGGSPFLVIKEIHLEYDRRALAERRLRLILLRLNLAEVEIVENQNGQSNLQMLQTMLQGKSPQAKPAGELDFAGIETLNLTLGKVKYRNLKSPSQDRVVDLGVRSRIFKNLKTPADLNVMLMQMLFQQARGLFGDRTR